MIPDYALVIYNEKTTNKCICRGQCKHILVVFLIMNQQCLVMNRLKMVLLVLLWGGKRKIYQITDYPNQVIFNPSMHGDSYLDRLL